MLIRRKQLSNISNNIKNLRLKEGKNQKEFARLLEMNYQNYSKMERGIYTPSLEKMLEICDILCITPNDLLLEGRDFDDYKKEVFEKLDARVIDFIDTIKIYEEQRAKIIKARHSGDEERERIELDAFIQLFAYTNEHYREIADFLYYKKLSELIKQISNNTFKDIIEKTPQI